MVAEKLPPHDVEAEEAVIGSLLVDGESIYRIAPFLSPQDFYREKHLWIYEACLAAEAIDQVTVAHELGQQGKLEAVGGAAYLSHLISEVPTSVHIVHYARIVKEMAVSRRLINAASQIAQIGYAAGPSDEALSRSLGVLVELGKDTVKQQIVTPQQWAEWAQEHYQEMAELQRPSGISFGFKSLDDIGVMQPGDNIIICGFTRIGKTTLLSQVARYAAQEGPALICSVEMTNRQVSDREVARLTGRPIPVIVRGRYNEELYGEIYCKGLGEIAESNLYYYFGSLSPRQIEFLGRQMQMQYGLVAIFVDYLQLLEDDRKGKSLYERASNKSQDIKNVAKALDVPIISACQLRRGETKPSLDSLRDSGRIEEDADWVLGLHRKENKDGTLCDGGELLILKQRQGGKVGTFPIQWNKQTQEYSEVEL